MREKRITLITNFEKKELNKIETLMKNIIDKTCKVPYGIDDEKRYEIDNLPYHFTIFATNKENQEKILEIAKSINIDKIQIQVKDVEIINIKYDSYCLYLSIEENIFMKQLQRVFYNQFPKERYNPDNFLFHMTLHIDKEYDKVLNMRNKIKENFKPFNLELKQLVLYDYPGDMIEVIKFNI